MRLGVLLERTGVVAEAQVFVGDNLSSNGGVKLSRKRTLFTTRDLPKLIQRALDHLQEKLDSSGTAHGPLYEICG